MLPVLTSPRERGEVDRAQLGRVRGRLRIATSRPLTRSGGPPPPRPPPRPPPPPPPPPPHRHISPPHEISAPHPDPLPAGGERESRGRAAGTSGKRESGGRAASAGAPKLTNPQRVYWPDLDITKQDLVDYYATVWDWMAPHVVRRPLALLRCPSGVGSECFVQKHAHATFDRSRILAVDDGGEELIAIDSLDGLAALVQAGVLEVHVWGSTIDRVDVCDRLVFDLDPGPEVGWPAVIDAAKEVRDRLAADKLESFVKTSGGKGLHVVVPFDGADWSTAKAFSKRLAEAMATDAPDRYVAKMTKSIRTGKIFVDYLRNGRGATAVAAFSPRARPGAGVSTPVAWREVTARLSPARWTLLNLGDRLKRLKADPWSGFGAVRQRLPGT
ncbi:Multifunctional non-homologous end joining protein LigD [Rhodoplanes sp. P11]